MLCTCEYVKLFFRSRTGGCREIIWIIRGRQAAAADQEFGIEAPLFIGVYLVAHRPPFDGIWAKISQRFCALDVWIRL